MIEYRVGDIVNVDYEHIHKIGCVITAIETYDGEKFAFLSTCSGAIPIESLTLTEGQDRMRDELYEFAMAMEHTLQKHDGDKKKSWRTMSREDLHTLLIQERSEVDTGFNMKDSDVHLELIDEANLCMMLWYNIQHGTLGKFEKKNHWPSGRYGG